MNSLVKRVAARLPRRWQQALKRLLHSFRIRTRRFETEEPEYHLLPSLVSQGDWVIDVGANVGVYTLRLSELVGPEGRVLAFEPVPSTFELLAANAAAAGAENVTLMNVAASDETRLATMEVPRLDGGLENPYMAHLIADGPGPRVLCLAIDCLGLPGRVRLVKIDAEGHDLYVLQGMTQTLRRDSPTLIVEDSSPEIDQFLEVLGYTGLRLPHSSNRIFFDSRQFADGLPGLPPVLAAGR
jgi:FkbM family methyltransferase